MTPKFDFATIIRDAKNPEAVTIKIDIGYDKTITEDDILEVLNKESNKKNNNVD